MNKSSVEAVDEAQKKRKKQRKKMEQAETKVRNEKKRAEMEIRKAKKEVLKGQNGKYEVYRIFLGNGIYYGIPVCNHTKWCFSE